jgi:hypothetical protein
VGLLEVDGRDLADLDPGDAYVVARLEATSLRQRRHVAAAAEQRDLVGVERKQQHRRDHGQTDSPDDHRVAFAEGCHHWHLAALAW